MQDSKQNLPMHKLNAGRLDQILQRAAEQRLLVIGDLMLDEFVWGKVGRISPETSTTGTGASGEMRPTLPQTNSSSIKSPMTSRRCLPVRSRICWSRSEFTNRRADAAAR